MSVPYELTREYSLISKRDKYLENINEEEGFINDIDLYLSETEYRLFNGGLDERDIKPLEEAINKINYLDYLIKRSIDKAKLYNKSGDDYDSLIKHQKYLLRVLGDIGIRFVRILYDLKVTVGKYDKISFIKDHSSLLHLVSTNNHSNQHIRKVSDDSYFYLCAFHNERSSSMMVKNNKNRLHCYGCGTHLNIFEYLSEIEGISYQDAQMLLAEINKIRLDDNPFKASDDLVKKYTCGKSLKRYELRVVAGRKRASNKNRTLNNILALEKFDQELDTIRRIRENEYIEYPQVDLQKRLLKVVD